MCFSAGRSPPVPDRTDHDCAYLCPRWRCRRVVPILVQESTPPALNHQHPDFPPRPQVSTKQRSAPAVAATAAAVSPQHAPTGRRASIRVKPTAASSTKRASPVPVVEAPQLFISEGDVSPRRYSRGCCHLHLQASACMLPCPGDFVLTKPGHERMRVVGLACSMSAWLHGNHRSCFAENVYASNGVRRFKGRDDGGMSMMTG